MRVLLISIMSYKWGSVGEQNFKLIYIYILKFINFTNLPMIFFADI